MESVTSQEFTRVLTSLGLDNSHAGLAPGDESNTTEWTFPGSKRVAGMIEQDHNGRFHYLDEDLVAEYRKQACACGNPAAFIRFSVATNVTRNLCLDCGIKEDAKKAKARDKAAAKKAKANRKLRLATNEELNASETTTRP